MMGGGGGDNHFTRIDFFAPEWPRILCLVTKHDAVIRRTGIAAGFSHQWWGVLLNHMREGGSTRHVTDDHALKISTKSPFPILGYYR